jgi:hypothetical protein
MPTQKLFDDDLEDNHMKAECVFTKLLLNVYVQKCLHKYY